MFDNLWPRIERQFSRYAILAVRAIPYMNEAYTKKIEALVRVYEDKMSRFIEQNPFGVLIATGGWAGNGQIINATLTN